MQRMMWLAILAVALGLVAFPGSAAAGPIGDLSAQDGHVLTASAGPGIDAVSASQVLDGTWSWFFVIDDIDVSVTNPTITVDSGYPVSAFPFGGPTGFPVAMSQASLDPGQSFFATEFQLGESTVPVTMSTGFDSTRSVSPLTIPVGGGHQVLTVTITPTTTLPQYKVAVDGAVPGVVVTQLSGPSDMNDFQAGVTYSLVYDLYVPNPFGVPFTFKPNVHINGGSNSITCCTGPTGSISFADPTLDGPQAGRGQVTYSVDQTVANWSINNGDFREIFYPGLVELPPPLPTSTDQCKNGGWMSFGVFKNQGDCVSYVATRGKNPPSGG